MPSPTFKADALAASRSRKPARTSRWTITRLVAVHFCPVDSMAPAMVTSTALSRSASLRTTTGFLPPISSWNLIPRSAHCAASFEPTALEPVKLMALMCGLSARVGPICEPRPTTRFKTPGGRPALSSTSARCQAVSGVSSAGLKTTVLPKARAGATFQVGMATGKFHGVMRATGPSGTRSAKRKVLGEAEGYTSPVGWSASPA